MIAKPSQPGRRNSVLIAVCWGVHARFRGLNRRSVFNEHKASRHKNHMLPILQRYNSALYCTASYVSSSEFFSRISNVFLLFRARVPTVLWRKQQFIWLTVAGAAPTSAAKDQGQSCAYVWPHSGTRALSGGGAARPRLRCGDARYTGGSHCGNS